MEKKKLILPTLSLSALLIAGSITYDAHHLFNRYPADFCEDNVDFYSEEIFPDAIEDNLQYTLNHSNFVPQGLSVSDDYFFISMYDFQHEFNSMINVYNKEGKLVNSCELRNKAHVGGISYDKKHQLLWVSSFFGHVDAYRLYDLVHKEQVFPLYKDLYLGRDLRSYNRPFETAVSYLAYDDDSLYVGNFTLNNKGTVKKYKVDIGSDRIVRLTEEKRFRVPNLVQGISFYESEGTKYMLLSRSCGIDVPSIIQIYKYDDSIDDYTNPLLNSKAFYFSPMIEQISTDDDTLYSLYESQATPYRDKSEEEKTLRKSDINDLLTYLK